MPKAPKPKWELDEYSPLFAAPRKWSQIVTPYKGHDPKWYDNWVYETMADLHPERMPSLDWFDHAGLKRRLGLQ